MRTDAARARWVAVSTTSDARPGVAPHRVVSLLASATELLCELGAGERLVGRSHECDHPSWVKRLPSVSRPTFDTTGSSAEIDARVRARLSAGKALYEVDAKQLVDLAPDLIITQTHCEVCAVGPGALPQSPLTITRRPVVALGASTPSGVLDDFLQVARVLGLAERGRELVQKIRHRLDALATTTRPLRHSTVVCLEWIDPIFPMSNWMPELVERAGGTGRLGAPGHHSTATPWDAVRQADPDVLVVAPCGFDLPRTLAEMPTLAARPGFRDLRAVRAGRVVAADGNLYFNRSGPSLFTTPELLAEILHGDVFPPLHEGTAWVRWEGAT
jgi:iron complex transport system substrate-binding protein